MPVLMSLPAYADAAAAANAARLSDQLCREVDRRSVTAGGVITATFPQVARNLRRSSPAWVRGRCEAQSLETPLNINCRPTPKYLCSVPKH